MTKRTVDGILSTFRKIITIALAACGGGGDGGANTSGSNRAGSVVTEYPRYALVTNDVEGTVASYVVDVSTGGLRYIGKVGAASGASSVALHPSGSYAYVVNLNGNSATGWFTR